MDEPRRTRPGASRRRGSARVEDIDPFRRRQIPDVAGRLLEARDRHKRQADLMWAGTLATSFTSHELRLLNDAGYLCPHDFDLLKQARRFTT